MSDTLSEDLIVKTIGPLGHLELNRPKALNALNLEMVSGMHRILTAWCEDESIEAVLVTGAGERAFCAGGDVKSVYFAGMGGELDRRGSLTADFFREEYTLNYLIANYPKPYIAYLDGVTMGGGVGIAISGSHRLPSPGHKKRSANIRKEPDARFRHGEERVLAGQAMRA